MGAQRTHARTHARTYVLHDYKVIERGLSNTNIYFKIKIKVVVCERTDDVHLMFRVGCACGVCRQARVRVCGGVSQHDAVHVPKFFVVVVWFRFGYEFRLDPRDAVWKAELVLVFAVCRRSSSHCAQRRGFAGGGCY